MQEGRNNWRVSLPSVCSTVLRYVISYYLLDMNEIFKKKNKTWMNGLFYLSYHLSDCLIEGLTRSIDYYMFFFLWKLFDLFFCLQLSEYFTGKWSLSVGRGSPPARVFFFSLWSDSAYFSYICETIFLIYTTLAATHFRIYRATL